MEYNDWYASIAENISPVKILFDQYYIGKGIVLDIGGNVGAFTDYVLEKHPDAKVYIFEPANKFEEWLKNKYDDKDNVTFIPLALGEESRPARIIYSNWNFGDNEITLDRGGGHDDVYIVSLDEIIEEKQITDISFIKIDVEFFEPFVLKGMKKYIESTTNLPIIVMEHNYHLSPYKKEIDEVFEWLFKYYNEFNYKNEYTEDIVLIPKK